MADNKLIEKKEGLVPLMEEKGLGEILKPLSKEIHLFDSFIAGISFIKDDSALQELKEGCRLSLRREESKFDDNAIILITPEGKKAGYVPEKDNVIFARLMDAGKLLSAVVTGTERKGTFLMVRIGIYLVDF